MAGRTKIYTANVPELQKLAYLIEPLVDARIDMRPLVAFTMHHCGATNAEIGQVLDVTGQQASNLIKIIEGQL